MRKSDTKDKQRDTARGLYIAEHSLRASDATGSLFDSTTKKADMTLRCMNLFSCGAVNACAQHDEKSRHEAEMHEFILMRRSERVCLLPPPHPPTPPPTPQQTTKQANKQTNDQTSNQASKEATKQANKQRRNKQRRNKQTSKQMIKQEIIQAKKQTK